MSTKFQWNWRGSGARQPENFWFELEMLNIDSRASFQKVRTLTQGCTLFFPLNLAFCCFPQAIPRVEPARSGGTRGWSIWIWAMLCYSPPVKHQNMLLLFFVLFFAFVFVEFLFRWASANCKRQKQQNSHRYCCCCFTNLCWGLEFAFFVNNALIQFKSSFIK